MGLRPDRYAGRSAKTRGVALLLHVVQDGLDVGALGDLLEADLLAFALVGEALGVAAQDLDAGINLFGALDVAGDIAIDRRDGKAATGVSGFPRFMVSWQWTLKSGPMSVRRLSLSSRC